MMSRSSKFSRILKGELDMDWEARTAELVDVAVNNPINYLLVKLVSSCNINCSYCYWFRDPAVLEGPRLLSVEVENALIKSINQHFSDVDISTFTFLFHGGEPMLFPKKRMLRLLRELKMAGERHKVNVRFAITTNGLLLDQDWCAICYAFGVSVTISFDGPTHDARRLDKSGEGTAHRVLSSINFARSHGIAPGILSVCDPEVSGKDFYNYMVNDQGLNRFDVLLPDADCDSHPPSIFGFYSGLFDAWYANYQKDRVEIRTFTAIIRGLLGLSTGVESFGYGVIATNTLLPNGMLEPLDVLRSNGGGFTTTSCDITKNKLQDLTQDSRWIQVARSSATLCEKCRGCKFSMSCGGGFLPNRWSKENGFLNPSSYCSDIFRLYEYIWSKLDGDYGFTGG